MTHRFIRGIVGVISWMSGILVLVMFFAVNYKPGFYDNWLDYLSKPDFLLIISFFVIWAVPSTVVKWDMLRGKHRMWINIMSVLSFWSLFYFFYKGPIQLPDEPLTLLFQMTIVSWIAIDLADLLLIDIFEKPIILEKPEIPEEPAIPKIKKSPRIPKIKKSPRKKTTNQ